MIVMMANIAQKNRALRRRRKLIGFFQRQGILRSPPGIEVAPMIATQPRPPPPAIRALRRLVMQTPRIHREPLQQKGASSADWIAAVVGQLLQKFLMAKKRVRRPRGFEIIPQ